MSARPGYCFLYALLSITVPLSGGTYYVDCSTGSDSADGRSPATAWRTRIAFSSMPFAPGDSLLLRRGTRCSGTFAPTGSGTAAQPITLGAYGDGPAPIIDGGSEESAVQLSNQQGWHIENIETTGGVKYGMHITGDRFPMNHFRITNVVVHDVYGPLTAKTSGLIVLDATKSAIISDVIIEGASAWNTTQWAGIMVIGAVSPRSLEGPHGSNVNIRNSVVHDVYGDGIVLYVVQNGSIERSVTWRTGQQKVKTIGTPNAIWTWMCNECTVQFNESWLSSSPEKDGGAFDIDWGNRNNVVQFNYGHESKNYCAAIFGAENLPTTGQIHDNLCIANSQGVTSGAEFEYYTWNSGWVAGSSIDHNASCIGAPGDSPVIWGTTDYNALDLRGVNAFHDNTAYSTGTLLVDAWSPLQLDSNSYSVKSGSTPTFRFNGKSYAGFSAYHVGSGQDANGTFGPLAAEPDRPVDLLSSDLLAQYRGGVLLLAVLDSSSDALSQLVVLRSMLAQYGTRGLQVVVAGNPAPEWRLDEISVLTDGQLAGRLGVQRLPAVFLVDSSGAVLKRWDGYASGFQIGPAVSRALALELVPGCPAERAMRIPVVDRIVNRLLRRGYGPTSSGAAVYILGSHFIGPDTDPSQTRVFFGSVAVQPVSVSETEVVAVVPAGLPAGPIRVQVEYRGVSSNSVLFPTAARSPRLAPD